MSAAEQVDQVVTSPAVRPSTVRRAYGEVLAVYALAFGPSVVRAVLILLHAYIPPVTHATLLGQLWNGPDDPVNSLACIALALVLAQRRGLSRADLGFVVPAPGQLRERVKFGVAGGAYFAVIAICGMLPILWHIQTGAVGDWSVLSQVPHGIISGGMLEEILLVAFLVATLRQVGQSWVRITVLALTLRVLFHLYYGPVAVPWVLVWAGAGFALYRWCGNVLPLIVAHATWDTLGALDQLPFTATVVTSAVAMVPIAVVYSTAIVAASRLAKLRRRDGAGEPQAQPA